MSWDNTRPLYVGKAEKKGVTRPISENIRNIRKNKHMFARWGDGLDYHIGDLSHALFRFKGYREPTKRMERRAAVLFVTRDPPILKEQVYLYVGPWLKSSRGPSGLRPCKAKEMYSPSALFNKAYDDETSWSVPICSSLTLKTILLLDFSMRVCAPRDDTHNFDDRRFKTDCLCLP